ncbi:MAG: tripartite tricarboxylate transporter TctB family protein [Pseudolabrys sp.]|nr:tripartite tricarboxylate transporter TctB family protein [Pseudolabrys sp.]
MAADCSSLPRSPVHKLFPWWKRDYYAGALMILLGLITAHEGSNYPLGTLNQMGPGYFPVALGILLMILGGLIAATATAGADAEEAALPHAEWRGWACIIGGPVLFILLGRTTGMLPATFACVFVAALGDRETTLKSALILAASVTVFGVILFHYLLKLPMPVVTWGGT